MKSIALKIRQIPVSQMFIDYAGDGGYQREKHEENALKIAAEFEASRYEPIHVSLRSSGKFAVVEGQTRYWVAILMGLDKIQSIVHEGMTRADEARLFTDLTEGRRKVGAYDRFKAKLCAGDPFTMSLQALVTSCNWRVAQGVGFGNVIRAVTALETAYRQHGAEAVEKALWLLEPWAEDHAPDGSMVWGMVDFVAEYGDKVDLKRLRSKLEKIPAATIQRRAKAKSGGGMGSMHSYVALEILAEWNKGRRRGGHLEALSDAA